MKTVTNSIAETNFSSLLQEVEKGEEVIIIKEGHPVARLVPTDTTENREKHQFAVQRLKEFRKCNLSGGLDWEKLRDEGRKE